MPALAVQPNLVSLAELAAVLLALMLPNAPPPVRYGSQLFQPA